MIGKGAEYTALVNRIAQEHNVKVDWRNRSDIPRDSFAFARVRAREIVVPHIQGDEASCQHGQGHQDAACPGQRVKRAPRSGARWHPFQAPSPGFARAARSIGSELGRQVLRGVLGSILGGKKR